LTANWSISKTTLPLDKRRNHTHRGGDRPAAVKAGIEHRLELSVGLAMRCAAAGAGCGGGGDEQLYSAKLACPDCGINVPQLEPRSFSL